MDVEYRWAQCSVFRSDYQNTCFLREGNTNGRLGRVLGMLTHIYRVRWQGFGVLQDGSYEEASCGRGLCYIFERNNESTSSCTKLSGQITGYHAVGRSATPDEPREGALCRARCAFKTSNMSGRLVLHLEIQRNPIQCLNSWVLNFWNEDRKFYLLESFPGFSVTNSYLGI